MVIKKDSLWRSKEVELIENNLTNCVECLEILEQPSALTLLTIYDFSKIEAW